MHRQQLQIWSDPGIFQSLLACGCTHEAGQVFGASVQRQQVQNLVDDLPHRKGRGTVGVLLVFLREF